MIDLYYWTTPNGHKITMFLEEAGLPYRIVPIHIGKGEQFGAQFLAIAPNNRIPAILDRAPAGGGAPISVFESGAILMYLAQKAGWWPADPRVQVETLQWLFWQMAGLGPMAGQNHHFTHYAPERIPYAIERYVNETNRLYGVLNRRLADRPYIAGRDYGIADVASYPWIVPHERQQQRLEDFPHLKRWFEAVRERPATVRAYARAQEINVQPSVTEESRRILFGQTAAVVGGRPNG
jgi:GST-like protein